MYEFIGKTEYIEHDDLEGMDLDWFALDDVGHIAHFATGGRGPVLAKLLKTDIRRLHKYIFEEAERISQTLESQSWLQHAQIKPNDKKKKDKYLSSFAGMSCKGIYSFDCSFRWDAPCLYFRIAIPTIPLCIDDLPEDIREILKKTRIKGADFSDCCQILPNQLGDYVI